MKYDHKGFSFAALLIYRYRKWNYKHIVWTWNGCAIFVNTYPNTEHTIYASNIHWINYMKYNIAVKQYKIGSKKRYYGQLSNSIMLVFSLLHPGYLWRRLIDNICTTDSTISNICSVFVCMHTRIRRDRCVVHGDRAAYILHHNLCLPKQKIPSVICTNKFAGMKNKWKLNYLELFGTFFHSPRGCKKPIFSHIEFHKHLSLNCGRISINFSSLTLVRMMRSWRFFLSMEFIFIWHDQVAPIPYYTYTKLNLDTKQTLISCSHAFEYQIHKFSCFQYCSR